MNSKNLNILLGITVIVLLGVIGYLLYTQQSNTQILSNLNYTSSKNTQPVNSNAGFDKTIPGNNSNSNTVPQSQTAKDSVVGQIYKNNEYGFEFQFPTNFKPVSDSTSISFDNEFQESINIAVVKEKLDPKNIQGLYGPVENPEQVKVGSQTGYSYLDGDAGCGGKVVLTALGNNTLRILFSACEDGENGITRTTPLLYENKKLINQVLATFKFAK